MKRIFVICILFFSMTSIARADSCAGYGTVVHADGSMTAIYRSKKYIDRVYIVKFTKDGKLDGGCKKESVAAWQARKAYMAAKSHWKAGYVPMRFPCML